jgi:hypothetical protein
MKKLYPLSIFLPLLFFTFSLNNAFGQTCPSLSFTYTTTESRCTSTGAISITVTSGAGNYNYKVIGPVTTPFTSSNVITGLQPGIYQIVVRDVNNNCENTQNDVVVEGSYADPRFLLNKTDASCLGNDGTINVYDIQFGRAPFDYTIISPSPSNVGVNNTTGHFTNLTPGEYAIQLRDSCGGIQVRRVTIESYSWWFENVAVAKMGCDSADATITLRDNKGNLNSGSLSFIGFNYGMVKSVGDTLWKSSKSFRFYLGTKRNITFVAKDNCGNVTAYGWAVPNSTKPQLSGSVAISNINCSSFSASVTGQLNLISPNYCLYDALDNIISCNSTGVFNNIPYGSYCIKTTDNCYDTTITRCFTQAKPVPGADANITSDSYDCTTFRASVTGQTNLTNPNYCLYNNSNNQISCNTTGIFSALQYGAYKITIENGCLDTTIIRNFSAARLTPALVNVSTSNGNCSSFTATATGSNLTNPQYCVFDTAGSVIACNTTGIFSGLANGSYCIRAISCTDTTNSICFSSTAPTPSVNNTVQVTNKTCSTFKATITGQTNLASPEYCLYDNAATQIECNNTGIFSSIPYGSYCIKITDAACSDTTITRCFSSAPPTPTINGTISKSNLGCTTFTATVSGTNLTNPTYSIFDGGNNLVETNSTGIFSGLIYGAYCAEIHDGCIDTTMRVCQSFNLNQSVSVSSSKTCTFDYTSLQINFSNSVAPYTINIYHPNGSLVYNTFTSNTSTTVTSLPALATGLKYKVVGVDNCGFEDSVQITPEASHITKSATAVSKCPSSSWQNGSGDINVSCSSNLYSVTPFIIKKDGAIFNLSYSSNSGASFVFSDIGPGTYIIQYTMQNCTEKMYDTLVVSPYSFPTQDKSAIYQCDNNSFSVGAVVSGGVRPYQYEIIGSLPTSPNINTGPQLSSVFAINNGTTYSLIRLRTVDACGNATLNDVSVLPLQNIAVTANTNCLYNNVTLSVDTLPNATYKWYYKRSATDSTLLDDSIVYNIPFLIPEETGTYVCKVSVNNDCITRLSYFDLTGDCGYILLASSVQLKGKKLNEGIELNWTTNNPDYIEYTIERKSDRGIFLPIGKLNSQSPGNYIFIDKEPASGANIYRLKITGKKTKAYTNTVNLLWRNNNLTVYPNPVKNKLNLSFNGPSANYKIQLVNISGQIIYQQELKNITSGLYSINRTNSIKPGIYLMKLINATGNVTIEKLIFE